MKTKKVEFKTYAFWFAVLLGIVLIFTAVDFLIHSLSSEYSVPDTYFRNKIIVATVYACILYYLFRKKSILTKALAISGITSVFLQTGYYLKGYPLDFVFLFMGIHFVILFVTSLIILKLAKM